MQNQQDDVADQTYQTNVPPRASEPAPRPLAGAGRRDFYDDPRRKSPVLALVLSLMPGVGQIYVGYYQQGFTNAIVAASIITLLSTEMIRGAEPLFGIFLGFFWLYNVVDAWRRAVFYNNALAGIGPAVLPDDFAVTKGRGTLAGGIALVIVGVIALSHTLFGVPLEWLDKWWPLAVIGLGAWLAYPAVAGKKKTDDTVA
jgi:TM2 domain-containing membrane protein YozV